MEKILDISIVLSNKEKLFLTRLAKRKNLYFTFSFLSVIIAVFLLVYHGLLVKYPAVELRGIKIQNQFVHYADT